MRGSVAVPVLSVLTVMAGALGLHVGQSAIGQINPIYFEGPAPPPRPAMSPPAPPDMPQSYLASYNWQQGQAALAQDCRDCTALNARTGYSLPAPSAPNPRPDPAVRRLWDTPPTTDHVRPEEAQPVDYIVERQPAEPRHMNRYLDYPVTADERPVRAPDFDDAKDDRPDGER